MQRLYYNKGNIQIVDCGKETEMIFSSGTSLNEFYGYCSEIESKGYAKVFDKTVKENVFAAFKNDEEYIYAYYTKYSDTVRTVHGPISMFLEEDCGDFEAICKPLISMIGQPEFMNCGQGYIYRLNDGRFLVQDGGGRYDNVRPDFMFEALKELSVNGKIKVAAWFISHPHSDHQDAFEEFIEKHGKDDAVEVERVVFNYAEASMYTYMRKDNQFEDNKALVERIYEKCEKYIPEAQIVKPHTGQIFKFGESTVEVLYTVEDVMPIECFDYVNGTSLVIRVTVCGQSAMLLADTTHTSGRILEKMFGDYLAADMVQFAHHGMWASYASLYELIAAKIVLWPNMESVAKGWLKDAPIATALNIAEDIYISDTGRTVLELPLSIVSNKKTVIERLNSL